MVTDQYILIKTLAGINIVDATSDNGDVVATFTTTDDEDYDADQLERAKRACDLFNGGAAPSPFKSPIWQRHGDKPRFKLEWEVVLACITDLLAAGYYLTIDHDMEEEQQIPITSADQAAMEELFACDEETLYVWDNETHLREFKDGLQSGCWFVRFVYGNEGWDTISDYSCSLEGKFPTAQAISDLYG